MNNMKTYIAKLNQDMGFSKSRHITEAKEGDVVIFVGGFTSRNAESLSLRSSGFSEGKEYTLRQDYVKDSYEGCMNPEKEVINGSIRVVEDDRGSKGNGWAAAFFKPKGN